MEDDLTMNGGDKWDPVAVGHGHAEDAGASVVWWLGFNLMIAVML